MDGRPSGFQLAGSSDQTARSVGHTDDSRKMRPARYRCKEQTRSGNFIQQIQARGAVEQDDRTTA